MQKTPIAPRPLADWLGQNVRFEGYLNHWETANKTGDSGFLLRNVQVIPYKGCKEQMRILDHIWLYRSKDSYAETKLERFGEYGAVGQVIGYTRSNGTKDFAIDTKPYTAIRSYLDLLESYEGSNLRNIQAKTIILKETLSQLEIEALQFGIDLSYEEVYQQLQNEYEYCQHQVEINERYQTNKQHRPKPNPQVITFTVAASKSTKVVRKGFATS